MRLAPDEPAKNHELGYKARGNDGHIWIVKKTAKSKRWFKHNTDNKPVTVLVSESQAIDGYYSIYEMGSNPKTFITKSFSVSMNNQYINIFQKDKKVRSYTKFMGLWVSGPGVLIQISRTKYIMVYDTIFSFKTSDLIYDLYKCYKNPKFIAFGTINVYSLLEHEYARNEDITIIRKSHNVCKIYKLFQTLKDVYLLKEVHKLG